MSLSRKKRERRIAEDDGAPDDTVYIRKAKRAAAGIAKLAYHESTECDSFLAKWEGQDEVTALEFTREEAQQHGSRPCMKCCDAFDTTPDETRTQEDILAEAGLLDDVMQRRQGANPKRTGLRPLTPDEVNDY